ncbi:hypothetical protein C8R47DRAFT_1192275 [Mycena vitilis]|nr:hypothetical protein C8R47DRAFT_1192275 [Mycena vitilis]
MRLALNDGGKQILDLKSRNEAIDLWNLKEFLRRGDGRANWPFFAEHAIMKRWDAAHTETNHGLPYNIFLQNIHIPAWRKDPLPNDISRMILAAKHFNLEFTGLSISKEIKLQMPIWAHKALIPSSFDKIRRKDSLRCLRHNHQTQTVADILIIADRKTTIANRPHLVNPSGIGRKNCGCPPCRRDRIEFGCTNPGECVEAARGLIGCIHPKWNPLLGNQDLDEELALTDAEITANEGGGEEEPVTFDPSLRLTDMSHGFRIFASEDHPKTTCTKRRRSQQVDGLQHMDVYLHAKILRAGEANSEMVALILKRDALGIETKEALRLTFSTLEVHASFNTCLLGGLLHVLLETPNNVPLNIYSPSTFLGKTLVTERQKSENNMLNANFQLIKCTIAAMQERTGRTRLARVRANPAIEMRTQSATPITVDTDIDVMFVTPGVRLQEGTQRSFTKIIQSLNDKPLRKSTENHLDRIRCCIADEFNFEPTDAAIWSSLRSTHIHRLSRNFLWKSVHNIYHVGAFWERIPHLEMFATCSACRLPESMEHIMLECESPGQRQIWYLAQTLWQLRYNPWPKLNWGLLLGCGLARFKSIKGTPIPAKNRFFAILISNSMRLLWTLRNERLFESRPCPSEREIHNRWVAALNTALRRDQLLTNNFKFGHLALKKHIVLKTWSGTLLDEDSLPDDWSKLKGVLVGIRPITQQNGVG